ncbi:hypothetical protein EBX31_03600 [bacterium]|nr:hypothetical protein [bacterium]
MSFCALEEAFAGPPNPPANGAKKKHRRPKPALMEGFVPTPEPDRPMMAAPPPAAEILKAPVPESGGGRVPADGVQLDDLFPMPGDTGDPDAWEKAFTLEGSKLPGPAPRSDGSIPVGGQPTLWRQIPVPTVVPSAAPVSTLAPIPGDINTRLDALTRQLEALTAPAPLATTAELFLFVAIGLLVLLAIDTILRFATTMATASATSRGGGRWRWRGGGRFR